MDRFRNVSLRSWLHTDQRCGQLAMFARSCVLAGIGEQLAEQEQHPAKKVPAGSTCWNPDLHVLTEKTGLRLNARRVPISGESHVSV